jgi:hypothetical protein
VAEVLSDGHVCKPPESNDFRDGVRAEGCWTLTWKDGRRKHYTQTVGESGVYLRVVDMVTGEILRDDRPWQMEVTNG